MVCFPAAHIPAGPAHLAGRGVPGQLGNLCLAAAGRSAVSQSWHGDHAGDIGDDGGDAEPVPGGRGWVPYLYRPHHDGWEPCLGLFAALGRDPGGPAPLLARYRRDARDAGGSARRPGFGREDEEPAGRPWRGLQFRKGRTLLQRPAVRASGSAVRVSAVLCIHLGRDAGALPAGHARARSAVQAAGYSGGGSCWCWERSKWRG